MHISLPSPTLIPLIKQKSLVSRRILNVSLIRVRQDIYQPLTQPVITTPLSACAQPPMRLFSYLICSCEMVCTIGALRQP